MKGPLLECIDVKKTYGGIVALDGLELQINPGEITGLIGPNGAGKTTFFNAITGVVKVDSGSITFKDQSLVGLSPHQICHLGIGRTFQSPKPLPGLSVVNNLEAAQYFGRARSEGSELPYDIEEVLDVLDLSECAEMDPDELAIIDQKLLGLARALMTGPDLLLLDEIMAGHTPAEKEQLCEKIETFYSDYGVDFVIVEHDLKMIRKISQRVIVIHNGRNLSTGSPEVVLQDSEVREAYAGA